MRWEQAWKERWQPGETISVSIGQGPLLVTPLQVAVYTSIIANRGRKVTPHLFNSQPQIGDKVPAEGNFVDIDQSSFELISEAIDFAYDNDAIALILLLDTPGGGLQQTFDIADLIQNSKIPVIGYVYPVG